MKRSILLATLIALSAGPRITAEQGRTDNPPAPTRADYERAQGLREKYTSLAVDVPEGVEWIGGNRFYYRKSVKGGFQFVLVDAATQQKQPAFDHARLAATLSKNTGKAYTATTLPFSNVTFSDDEKTIDVTVDQERWRCTLADYSCRTNNLPSPPAGNLRGVNGPVREWPNTQDSARPRVSPDGKWEAIVLNYNVAIRPAGGGKATIVTGDGSEANYYELTSVQWSPDSSKLAAYRVKAGHRRYVHYVESSPEDQLQPKSWQMLYAKPGDVLDLEQPVIIDRASGKAMPIANDLFPNPFDLSTLAWRKDGRAVSFEYNQRGH